MSDNKFTVILAIFSSILTLLIFTFLKNQNNTSNEFPIHKANLGKVATYLNPNIKKNEHLYTKEKSQNDPYIEPRNIPTQELNYQANNGSLNMVNDDDSINELINEIESHDKSSETNDNVDIELSLAENKIFVYVGKFNETNAIRIIEYLKYLQHNAFLKIIDNKFYFVIVEFQEHEKADSFMKWAKNNSFPGAKLIITE